ncbi:thiamine pyrophosphate-binding protein [Sphingosinicella sp.]|uniref:thiamine pyrophosphate-binding protein n=1 Tax=Sphingosinicella sp. TaxID=1917971 RepID=UPI0025F11062|nr:thiamine pyrophosphate-binding protein [Sphingosinicella sp.]
MLRAGDMVVAALRAEAVDTAFGIVGSHVVGIYDALRRAPSIRAISARHESTVSFMAAAYARFTGRTGVGVVTAGPGVLNAMNGLAQAAHSGWPVVLLAGGVPCGAQAFELHALQREDYCRDAVAPLVKSAVRVRTLQALGPTLAEAFRLARSGRPGPTYVEIPLDLFSADAGGDWYYSPVAPTLLGFAEAEITAARAALRTAAYPVVVIDAGAAEGVARALALDMAEDTGARIAVTRDALGAVSEQHPLYIGVAHEHMFGSQAFAAINEADICVLFGIDSEAANYERIVSRAAGRVLLVKRRMTGGVASCDANRLDIETSLRKVVINAKPSDANLFVETLAALRARLDMGAITVVDAGNHEVWARTLLPIHNRHNCIGGGDWASMGFALPAALAARVAEPRERIVCVTGDGCLLMSLSDLSTLFELGGPSLLIVLNDSEYGMMSDVQVAQFGAAYEVCLPRVDFAAMARAMGGDGERVLASTDLAPALDRAFAASRPFVLDIVCERPSNELLEHFQQAMAFPLKTGPL